MTTTQRHAYSVGTLAAGDRRTNHILCWELETLSCVSIKALTYKYVWHLDISPDGSELALATNEGCHILNIDSLDTKLELAVGNTLVVAYSPDGKWLATCSDTTTRLFSTILTTQESECTDMDANMRSLSFTPSSDKIATSAPGGSVVVRKVPGLAIVHRLTGHTHTVGPVLFLSDNTLASSGRDGIVRVWDVGAGTLVKAISDANHKKVSALTLSPDGSTFASASDDDVVRIYDAVSLLCIKEVPISSHMFVQMAYSSKDQLLIASYHNSVQSIDLTSSSVRSSTEKCGAITALRVTGLSWFLL